MATTTIRIRTIRAIYFVFNFFITMAAARRFDEIELITNNQFLNTRNAIKVDAFKWPNGVIPFAFHEEYTITEQNNVLEAMEIFNEQTCVSFVRKTYLHPTYILFRKHMNRCTSSIGYRNTSEPIEVAYSNYCLRRRGAMQHEMLHVIGLVHEQCRYDRDDFIRIIWENIDDKYFYNFVKVPNTYFDTYNLTYDYGSLMHYPGNAFAKKGENVTMVSKLDPKMNLGQIQAPSYYDLEKVRRMYGCR